MSQELSDRDLEAIVGGKKDTPKSDKDSKKLSFFDRAELNRYGNSNSRVVAGVRG